MDSLYEKALLKRDSINRRIDKDFNTAKLDPSRYWRNYQLEDVEHDVTIGAGDGSINKNKYMGFIFYAIDAECLIYNEELEVIESCEIDIIPHHQFVEDRLRSQMGIHEIKNALKAFEKYDLDILLFDGSILGNLIRPLPLEKNLKTGIKDEIKAKYLPELEDVLFRDLKNSEVNISSAKFNDDLEGYENTPEAMIYLEGIENLLVIGELLKNHTSLVGISKTSTSTEYFESEIPDMAVFDRHSRSTGYTRPKYVSISEMKREFPVKNNFFKGLTFTIFYARLQDHKNILKFELPYHATEEDIKRILGVIKSNSAEGYPLLLKKAHNDVTIRKVDLERLSKIVGLMEKSGREML